MGQEFQQVTPKWEGPYRVIRVTRPDAVRLETEDAIPLSNSYNIEHLRKFYLEGAVVGPPDRPPFVQALPTRHVTLCTKPGADPEYK